MVTNVSNTITVGDRTFHRVGSQSYLQYDGSLTVLAVWQGMCVVCGAPFEVKTVRTRDLEGSKCFTVTTCPAHKPTPSERPKRGSSQVRSDFK